MGKKDQDFKFNQLLHKVRTPIETVNIAGGGGLEFGGMVETWGPSKGGKSTFCYETAENFLEDYGDKAVVLLLPSEGVPNKVRLKRAFNLDADGDDRIWVFPAFTIEEGNDQILRAAKETKEAGKLLLVIWDSISASTFKNAYDVIQKSMTDEAKPEERNNLRNANEPMQKAAVTKWMLNNCLAAAYSTPIIVFFINQATTKVNKFQTSEDSSGGYSLRHNVNERFKFEFKGKIGGGRDAAGKKIDKAAVAYDGTESNFIVNKSRNIPSLFDIELAINDRVGGRFMPEVELMKIGLKIGAIEQTSGGWYTVPWAGKKAQKLQKADFLKSEDALAAVREALKQYLIENYSMVQWTYEAIEGAR